MNDDVTAASDMLSTLADVSPSASTNGFNLSETAYMHMKKTGYFLEQYFYFFLPKMVNVATNSTQIINVN